MLRLLSQRFGLPRCQLNEGARIRATADATATMINRIRTATDTLMVIAKLILNTFSYTHVHNAPAHYCRPESELTKRATHQVVYPAWLGPVTPPCRTKSWTRLLRPDDVPRGVCFTWLLLDSSCLSNLMKLNLSRAFWQVA